MRITTENVRYCATEGYTSIDKNEFDNWLAQHDAEVTAQAEARIVKLLEACPKDEKWHLDNLMCCEGRCDFAIQDYQDRVIALIKGETE